MKELFNPAPVFIEITPVALKMLRENSGIELPLERGADGKLTAASREKTMVALQDFLGRKSWQPRVRAICGLSAHGVSLRKIALPVLANGEIEQVLRLQIEKEFPLSPDELAWGWQEISSSPATREVIVVAVRKEVVENYAGILSEAGLNSEFILSAFARELLCPAPKETHAILEINRNYSELVSFENGLATGLKILPATGDTADSVLKNSPAKIVYVSGNEAPQNGVFEKLGARMDCRRLEVSDAKGFSAATVGIKKSLSENISLLRLRSKPKPSKASLKFSRLDFSRAENRLWLTRAAVLLALLLIFPFAESLLIKPFLQWKLDRFKNERQKFVSVVEPELRFLQSLKQSQPPYLDTIYVFSQAAPSGLHLDSLTISQHGDITVKATMQNAQQVMDFRSKLIASGFFSGITVEEQSPVPNQPKVNVRMTAQWKPANARPVLKIGTSTAETGNTNSSNKMPTS